jgi:transposase-like protein
LEDHLMEAMTSLVRTGHTASNGNGTSRKELRAPKPPGVQRAQRRVFTQDYKLAILAEYDRCSEPGEKGALLRREGLYSSLITDWRRQHRDGSLVVTPGRSEGGRGGPSRSEVARLRAENDRLKRKLAKAEAIIEVQGKVHALLEELSKSADIDESWTESSTTE